MGTWGGGAEENKDRKAVIDFFVILMKVSPLSQDGQ